MTFIQKYALGSIVFVAGYCLFCQVAQAAIDDMGFEPTPEYAPPDSLDQEQVGPGVAYSPTTPPAQVAPAQEVVAAVPAQVEQDVQAHARAEVQSWSARLQVARNTRARALREAREARTQVRIWTQTARTWEVRRARAWDTQAQDVGAWETQNARAEAEGWSSAAQEASNLADDQAQAAQEARDQVTTWVPLSRAGRRPKARNLSQAQADDPNADWKEGAVQEPMSNVMCCDGTQSPTCVYPHRGCCSYHGGVCG